MSVSLLCWGVQNCSQDSGCGLLSGVALPVLYSDFVLCLRIILDTCDTEQNNTQLYLGQSKHLSVLLNTDLFPSDVNICHFVL